MRTFWMPAAFASALQRLQRLDDGLRDRHMPLIPGLGANQRRVRRVLQVDSIPPQRQDLALPHRRRSGQGKERTHLAVTLGLVPKRSRGNLQQQRCFWVREDFFIDHGGRATMCAV
jgi:hypothetical protein